MGTSGSPRAVIINGIPYSPTSDGNFTINPPTETEAIPHAAGNMMKVTKMPGNIESVKLTLEVAEYAVLKDQVAEQADFPMSVELADGSTFRASGRITLGPFQSEDLSCEVTMIPALGDWEPFAA